MIAKWFGAVRPFLRPPMVLERRRIPHARARLSQRTIHTPNAGAPRQLLVDISVIHRHDAGTGIQRVVRAILSQLQSEPHDDFVIRPVAATRREPYRYVACQSTPTLVTDDETIAVRPGDVFLGLDLSAHIVPAHHRQLTQWKIQGATLHFVVYDLLPLHRPEWFSGKLVAAFHRWLSSVAMFADGAFCISPGVAEDLTTCLEGRFGLSRGTVPTRVIPMGWDITASQPSRGLPPDFENRLSQLCQGQTALMVGTLEPRKAHAQVLDAFEMLWQSGMNCNLAIVGQPGWKTESLQKRLRSHPLLNRRLYWFDDASDEALLRLYGACDGVIVASQAEGFGLPLIEALGHGKPVLARDLPVFRHFEPQDVEYFVATDAPGFASDIATWFKRIERRGITPLPRENPPCWRDTVTALVRGIEANSMNSALTAPADKPNIMEAA